MKRDAISPAELWDLPLPSDPIAERMVAGTKLLNPNWDFLGTFDDHFLDERARIAWAVMRQMEFDQEPIDVSHFVARLRREGLWDDVGGQEFVQSILAEAQISSRLPEYLERLRDLWRRRKAYLAAMTVLQSVHGKQSTQDLLEAAAAQFDIFASDARPATQYEVLSLDDLVNTEHETTYYVDNMFAAGESCIIGAPPKSMKTSFVTDFAVSMATATPVLGIHQVPQAIRVGVMSGESGRAASRICYRSVLDAKGFSAIEVPNLFWTPSVPRVGTREHAAAMRKMIRDHRPDVLIIDPAYRALQCESPDNIFKQGALLGELDDLCRSGGATLVLVHHTKRAQRGSEFAPTTLDDLAWAGFREFFRQWILISRRKEYAIGSGIHELRIDTGGSARHSWSGVVTIDEGPQCDPRWYVTVQGLAESHEAEQAAKERSRELERVQKQERNRQKLVEAAAKFPEGETLSTISDHAGLSRRVARDALADALTRGEMQACTVTKNGRSESGYKLKT